MLDKITFSDELKDKNFLRAIDLAETTDGDSIVYREQVLTIKDINLEKITDMEKLMKAKTLAENKAAVKEAYVLYFSEPGYKPYVVSAKVVIQSIEEATQTKIVNNWIGKKIKFYVEKNVRAFGKTTDALRVSPVPIKTLTMHCECCGKEISETIYNGTKKKCGYGVCSEKCRDEMLAKANDTSLTELAEKLAEQEATNENK